MKPQEQFEQEIKLSINKRLYELGYITESVYRQAKIKIVGDIKKKVAIN